MEIPKDQVLELIRQQRNPEQASQAEQELPDRIDPQRDSGVLAKFGIQPQDLLSKFSGGLPGL